MTESTDKVSETDAQQAAGASPGGTDALAAYLQSTEVVSPAALERARRESARSGRSLHALLAESEPSREEGIYGALADFLGVPFEPLRDTSVDPALVGRLPSRFALEKNVAPLRKEGDGVLVVTGRPDMLLRSGEVATRMQQPVVMALAPPSRLERFIQACYGLGADAVNDLIEGDKDSSPRIELVATEPVSIGETLDSAQEASATRFVNQLLFEAVKSQASDIHVEPYERQLRVRFRIDGMLQEVPVPPAIKQMEQAIISRIKVLADMDIAEKRLTQDGQIRLNVAGRVVDVRVSVVPCIYGESLVLRILDRQAHYRSLGEIGMPGPMLQAYREVLSLAQGLILVTGPTGSGKTTTLYASLNLVNGPSRKIVTIEDPVEYRLEGITQIQVRESIGLGFSSLLRNIVRHDPDVIMIGEIRDAATADIALNAAITGHLVLATLHTSDAPTAISRLSSMGMPRYMIAAALKVVLAQRLVRVICQQCRRPAQSLPDEAVREYPELAQQTAYQGSGCDRCLGTGYHGRTGVYEALRVTPSISELIATGKQAPAIREAARKQGLIPLRPAGVELVKNGVTTFEELYRVTRDVEEPLPEAPRAEANKT
jgi:general secretion pathway protein E